MDTYIATVFSSILGAIQSAHGDTVESAYEGTIERTQCCSYMDTYITTVFGSIEYT